MLPSLFSGYGFLWLGFVALILTMGEAA